MSEAFDRKRQVVVGESGLGPYGQLAVARRHVFTSDEPAGLGGRDTGPDPVELLLSSLAACTAMTMRMYAERHKLDIGRITVTVEHEWAKDEAGRTQDSIRRILQVEPAPEPQVMDRLRNIAERCPVHRMLSHGPQIETVVHA